MAVLAFVWKIIWTILVWIFYYGYGTIFGIAFMAIAVMLMVAGPPFGLVMTAQDIIKEFKKPFNVPKLAAAAYKLLILPVKFLLVAGLLAVIIEFAAWLMAKLALFITPWDGIVLWAGLGFAVYSAVVITVKYGARALVRIKAWLSLKEWLSHRFA